jgi:glutaredoxin
MPACFTSLRFQPVVVLTLVSLLSVPALAQGVYRIVGPDGRVTYSDQPPPPDNQTRPVTRGTTGTAPAGSPSLPFALRQAASRFPVTLYTSTDCNPCRIAATYLERRGVPFTEKTVQTNADLEALQRLSGGMALPVLSVGRQQLRGFTESEWKQYLDAAGYPEQSVLPASYRRPPATPLVEASPAPAPSSAAPAAQDTRGADPAADTAPPPVTPPPGIRF